MQEKLLHFCFICYSIKSAEESHCLTEHFSIKLLQFIENLQDSETFLLCFFGSNTINININIYIYMYTCIYIYIF